MNRKDRKFAKCTVIAWFEVFNKKSSFVYYRVIYRNKNRH